MSVVRELVCNELVELVSDYLDGNLSPGEHARVEQHLAGCDGCQVYLEQIRVTAGFATRLTPDDLPPELLDRLQVAFRRWSEQGHPRE